MARATKARANPPGTRARSGVPSAAARIDRAIETCWLLAAVLVPLVVLPESSFISFTSVPKVAALRLLAGAAAALLAVRWAMASASRRSAPSAEEATSRGRARATWSWLTATPGRTILATIIGVVTITAISAATSVSPYLSVFGKDPGSDGYDLYNTICYAVLGVAVATVLRTRAQVFRLLAAITAAGTLAALVAVFQNYGFSPLDISGTAGVRVTGTAGNPIFLGSLVVLTLPVSLAVLAIYAGRTGYRPLWWVLAFGVTGVQVAALAFTLSRGPWLGAAFGLLTCLCLMWFYSGRRAALASGAVLAVSFAITLIALSFPALVRQAPGAPGVKQRIEGAVTSGSVVSRAASVDEEVSHGLSGRVDRWSASIWLSARRPPVPEGADPGRAVRLLLGYGPDMLRFAFPLKAPADLSAVRTDAAHNDHLNRVVELGILGAVAYLLLGIAVAFAIVRLIRGARSAGQTDGILVGCALGAAFVGRIVEQGFGIAKPADLTIEWLLIGLAAASSNAFVPVRVDGRADGAPAVAAQRASQPKRAPKRAPASAIVVAVVCAVVVSAVAALTWTKGINYLRADNTARGTVETFGSDPGAGLRQIESAISLAPDVRDYYHRRSLMLQAVADADPSRAQAYLREAVADDLHAVDLNPMSIDSNLAAGFTAWRLAQSGDVQMALQTLAIYERLARLTPQNPLVQSRLEALRSSVTVTPSGTQPGGR